MHLKKGLIASLLAAPLTALAEYHVDMLKPNSPMADDAYALHWGILWVCVAIFFVVFGAMFWSVFKHRRSEGAVAAQFHENTTIEIIWTLVPLVVLVAMAWPATRTMIEMKDASNADMAIKVTATSGAGTTTTSRKGCTSSRTCPRRATRSTSAKARARRRTRTTSWRWTARWWCRSARRCACSSPRTT